MVKSYKKPSEIRFTQDSIAGRFQNGYILNTAINELENGRLVPEDFPSISVVWKNGKLYSFDNRRLYIFRVAEYRGIINEIPVQIVESWRLREDRFTTENDGVEIYVRQGGTKEHYRNDWLQELVERGNMNLPATYSTYSPLTFNNRQVDTSGSLNTVPDIQPIVISNYINTITKYDDSVSLSSHSNSPTMLPKSHKTRRTSTPSSIKSSSSSRKSSARDANKIVTTSTYSPKLQPSASTERSTPAVSEVSVRQTQQRKKSRFRRFIQCFCCCFS